MTFRSYLTLLAVLLSALVLAWGTGRATAGPVYEFAITDTTLQAAPGSTGSLEFQYTQDPLNPASSSATVWNLQGVTFGTPSPTAVYSGTPTGTLTPPGLWYCRTWT